MKIFLMILGLSFAIYSCGPTKSNGIKDSTSENDIVRIANDSLEYEIIILEPGFKSWLVTQPKSGFYGQKFLENKNRSFVSDYNTRVLNPNRYSRDLYQEQINYDPTVDYGYEVNYMLYNYFLYFQDKYKQQFTGSRN